MLINRPPVKLPAPPAAIYRLTLLRHGQSIGNAEGRYQGQTDFVLSPAGHQQASRLAARWTREGVYFDRIITSPLKRASQTAETIAQALPAPVDQDADWMERDNGLLAGLTHIEASQRHPRPPFIPLFESIGSTGESQWELFLRAGRAMQRLLRQPPGNYLVVSHGGILNMALYVALGMTPQPNFHGARFRFGNTAYAVLIYHPTAHDWVVDRINDHAHLDYPGND